MTDINVCVNVLCKNCINCGNLEIGKTKAYVTDVEYQTLFSCIHLRDCEVVEELLKRQEKQNDRNDC